MGIIYNKDILGKNYYIDLYNKNIQSISNQNKIRNELNKDQMYSVYFNQKLRKANECSLNFDPKNDFDIKDGFKNKCFLRENEGKHFSNFYKDFLFNALFAHFCVNSYHYLSKNFENIKINCNKLFPFKAMKKYSTFNIIPKIKEIIIEFMNFIDNILYDKYKLLIDIILFTVLVIILIYSNYRKNK